MPTMSPYFHHHCDCECHRPQYIVLFSGDDSDFVGNQTIFIELETDIDTTGCKAHLKYISKTFTWKTIPEDKRLELVFSAEETKAMPLGDWDAELWLEDAQGRRRTVSNQIRIRVTKSVGDAYGSEDPQSIKASIGNAFDYNNAYNKPTLNGVVIEGNKTSKDYHIKDGGGGTGDYKDLENKPKVNGVELVGNKSLDSLGAQAKLPTTEYDTYDITVTMADKAASDLYGRAISTTYAKVQDVYDKSEVDGKLANMVSKDDVVPVGDGTETIATIGGKDIKAPAAPVSSVNGKMGEVKLVAENVGALSNRGGTVHGSIFMYGQTGATDLQVGAGGYGGSLVVYSGNNYPASIKKDNKEVATEESIAPEYSPSSAYAVGSFVYHDGNIYQCTTAVADGGEEWDAAHWELRKLDDFFTNSNSLLVGTIKANAGGDDEKTQAVFSAFARMDDFTTASDESDSFDIAITKLSQLLGEDVAA